MLLVLSTYSLAFIFFSIIKDELSMSLRKVKPAIKSHLFFLLKDLALEIVSPLSCIIQFFFSFLRKKIPTNPQSCCYRPYSKNKPQKTLSCDFLQLLLIFAFSLQKIFFIRVSSVSPLLLFFKATPILFGLHHDILAAFNQNISDECIAKSNAYNFFVLAFLDHQEHLIQLITQGTLHSWMVFCA